MIIIIIILIIILITTIIITTIDDGRSAGQREIRLDEFRPELLEVGRGVAEGQGLRGGRRPLRAFIKGGCSGRWVQRMGVVLYDKLVYNSLQITTPCFHCTPL